jgi:hypothetical protein
MSRFTTTAPMHASSAHSDRAGNRRARGARLGWTSLISESTARCAVLCAALLFAGCGTYGPGKLQPGQTEADARAELGEPTQRSTLPNGGTRLDYARGPMGRHTWRVELDAQGRVVSIEQLLTERNFESLRAGDTREEVVARLGPATNVRVGWRGVGTVWAYRYETPPPYCRWFVVWLVDDRVREASYAHDPQCDDSDRHDDLRPG